MMFALVPPSQAEAPCALAFYIEYLGNAYSLVQHACLEASD